MAKKEPKTRKGQFNKLVTGNGRKDPINKPLREILRGKKKQK